MRKVFLVLALAFVGMSAAACTGGGCATCGR
jgi:hypothetical protein